MNRIVLDRDLPQPSWKRANTGPMFLRQYVGGTLLTLGMYSSAQAAMNASDVGDWLPLGSGWRSADGRTIIEEPRT